MVDKYTAKYWLYILPCVNLSRAVSSNPIMRCSIVFLYTIIPCIPFFNAGQKMGLYFTFLPFGPTCAVPFKTEGKIPDRRALMKFISGYIPVLVHVISP